MANWSTGEVVCGPHPPAIAHCRQSTVWLEVPGPYLCGQLRPYLLDVQDRLGYLIEDDLLTLARDAEQAHGTVRNAVGVVVHHLDAARQVLAVLETRGLG